MTVALPLGRVGFVPRKDYAPGQECFPLDAVNHRNTLWACLAQTTDLPGPDSPNWMAMLSLAAGLAPGGGLAVNEDGLIFVAPDGFSESLLEELMRRLRVPIWLESNTDWYVDPINGSDDNQGGSPEEAFKTVQAAANYVSENYNMGIYTATINLAAGNYVEDIVLPKYQASTGRIVISGPSSSSQALIKGAFCGESGVGHWRLRNIKIQYDELPSPNMAIYFAVRSAQGARIDLINTTVDCGTAGTHPRHGATSGSGSITLYENCSFSGQGVQTFLSASGNGSVIIFNDVAINGTVAGATVTAYSCGSLSLDSSLIGRAPRVTGTVTGNRAQAYANGVINSGGSGGAAAFPGTVSPAPATGGQII